MTFSIKNGLKLSWAHLQDDQMFFGWFMFVPVPSIACVAWRSWLAGVIWFIVANMVYILIRCWDDPVKAGWSEK